MQIKKLSLPVVALGLIASIVSPSHAQMLKDIAEAAPNENIGPMPHEVPGDPTKMNIKQDKSTNIWRELREGTGGKEPGPIDIQRYNLQMEPVGIQTFFKLPVAITPEDLKAGEIDIAIFGAPTGALPHSAGNMWAPAEVRTTRDYGGYGDPQFPLSWIEYETLIAPFTILNAVDYGDVGLNPYNQSHTMEEIRRVTREVASVGAIPFIVGGDHSVPNGTYRGIVDVYGKNNVAILHFDVHLDRDMGLGKFGAYYHSGVFMNRAVEEGMVEGRHIIQYGMSTPVFGAEEYDKAAADGAKVYHIHEIAGMAFGRLSTKSMRTSRISILSMFPSTSTPSIWPTHQVPVLRLQLDQSPRTFSRCCVNSRRQRPSLGPILWNSIRSTTTRASRLRVLFAGPCSSS